METTQEEELYRAMKNHIKTDKEEKVSGYICRTCLSLWVTAEHHLADQFCSKCKLANMEQVDFQDEEDVRIGRVKDMIYFGQILLAHNVEFQQFNLVLEKLFLRDYRQVDRLEYSVLTLRWFWRGEKVVESKYDYGVADNSLEGIKLMMETGQAFFTLDQILHLEAEAKHGYLERINNLKCVDGK